MSAKRYAGARPRRPYAPPVPSKLLSRRSQAYYGNVNRWSIIEEDRARQRAEEAAQQRRRRSHRRRRIDSSMAPVRPYMVR